MASTLTRLYRYAKAVGAEAKENFTTEALRAAIEDDPIPFFEALYRATEISRDPSPGLIVETQRAVRGVGRIDMVLTFAGGSDRQPLWIEIKVDAGESGDQLANYDRFVSSYPELERPLLVVVGPKRLRAGLPWLSWQQLRSAIDTKATSSPYWRDFRTYLEEIRMADSYDETVTLDEARALLPARRLLGKIARVLAPFARDAQVLWPGSEWPVAEAKVVGTMLSSFQRHGTFSIENTRRFAANVAVGLWPESTDGDSSIGIWVWCRPNRVVERRKILDLASTYTWEEHWSRDEAEWELFGAYRKFAEFGSHEEARAWLSARLVELRDRGVLELISTLGSDAATPSESADE